MNSKDDLTSNNDSQLPLFPFEFTAVHSYLFLLWYVQVYFILARKMLFFTFTSYGMTYYHSNEYKYFRAEELFKELGMLLIKTRVIQYLEDVRHVYI